MKSVHEITVTGLGSHRVGSKESHAEDFGLRVVLRGKSATNNVVVVNLGKNEHFRHKEAKKIDKLQNGTLQAY